MDNTAVIETFAYHVNADLFINNELAEKLYLVSDGSSSTGKKKAPCLIAEKNFREKNREQVMQENPDMKKKGDVTKKLKEMWKQLTKDEKKQYYDDEGVAKQSDLTQTQINYYVKRVSDGEFLTVHQNRKHVYWTDSADFAEHFYLETIDETENVLVSKTNKTFIHKDEKGVWQSYPVKYEKKERGKTFNAAIYARIVYESITCTLPEETAPEVPVNVSAEEANAQEPPPVESAA
eukprot:1164604-Pyramimonas_sp.AAC.2